LIVLIYQIAKFNFHPTILLAPVMPSFEKPQFTGRGQDYPANMTISWPTLAQLAGALKV
jgi:hypothetical protein